jgi:hypothetical protein
MLEILYLSILSKIYIYINDLITIIQIDAFVIFKFLSITNIISRQIEVSYQLFQIHNV